MPHTGLIMAIIGGGGLTIAGTAYAKSTKTVKKFVERRRDERFLIHVEKFKIIRREECHASMDAIKEDTAYLKAAFQKAEEEREKGHDVLITMSGQMEIIRQILEHKVF